MRSYVSTCQRVCALAQESKEDEGRALGRTVLSMTEWLWLPIICLLVPAMVALGKDFPRGLTASRLAEAAVATLLFWIRYRLRASVPTDLKFALTQRRCKYCGRYTAFIPPNHGFAYMGSNNCERCRRGYPMPSVSWDSDEGREYMYERGSVTEPEFYVEFERDFPGRPRSKMADHYLNGKAIR